MKPVSQQTFEQARTERSGRLPVMRVSVAFDLKGMKMSAKLINSGHHGATLTATPTPSSIRPCLDRPPVAQIPKRFPVWAPANGRFNPGARWLEFHLDGPWFKKLKPVRLDRSRPLQSE